MFNASAHCYCRRKPIKQIVNSHTIANPNSNPNETPSRKRGKHDVIDHINTALDSCVQAVDRRMQYEAVTAAAE